MEKGYLLVYNEAYTSTQHSVASYQAMERSKVVLKTLVLTYETLIKQNNKIFLKRPV